MATFERYLAYAKRTADQPCTAHLGRGRVYWNVLYTQQPKLALSLVGSAVDPAGDDSRISAFLNVLANRWGSMDYSRGAGQ